MSTRIIVDEDSQAFVITNFNVLEGFISSVRKYNLIQGLPQIESYCEGVKYTIFLDINRDVWFYREGEPIKIKGILKIDKIQTQNDKAFLLDFLGNVWMVRYQIDLNVNKFYPEQLQKIKDISSADDHTIFVDINNEIWVYGNNVNGQLIIKKCKIDIPTKVNFPEIKKVICGSTCNIFIDFYDRVWLSGQRCVGENNIWGGYRRDESLDRFENFILGYLCMIALLEGCVYFSGYTLLHNGVNEIGEFTKVVKLPLIERFENDWLIDENGSLLLLTDKRGLVYINSVGEIILSTKKVHNFIPKIKNSNCVKNAKKL